MKIEKRMKFRISFICLITINITLCSLFVQYGLGSLPWASDNQKGSWAMIQGWCEIWSWSQKRSFQGERITKVLLYGNILITILGILSESLGWVFISVLANWMFPFYWLKVGHGGWKSILRILNERLCWKYENLSILEILCYGNDSKTFIQSIKISANTTHGIEHYD